MLSLAIFEVGIRFIINRIGCILAAVMFVNHPLLSVSALSENPLINNYNFGRFKLTFDLSGSKYGFALLTEKDRGKVFTLSARSTGTGEAFTLCAYMYMMSVYYLVELILRPIINLNFCVARNWL